MKHSHSLTHVALGAALAIGVATLAGCSAPAADTDEGVVDTAGLSAFAQDAADATQAALAEQVSNVPDGPAAQTGKSVVIIPPAGSTTEGGYRTSLAAQDAAQALGWDVTYINPNGDLNQMNAAIQKAIAIGADGIVTVSIDGNAVLSALQQAKDSGIALVGAAAANSEGETGIYDVMVPDVASGEANGYLLGQQAYVATDGHIKAIDMAVQGFGYVDARQVGWEKFIDDCKAVGGDCKILQTADFAAADIATSLPQLTASTARLHPDYNVLWAGFDSGLTFMIQGLEQGGLINDDAIAVGFDGNLANLDMIRKDGFQRATVGLSTLCIGYAAIDSLNRIFAGEEPLVGDAQGCQNKLLTSENVPAEGPWWGDVDVREDYWKMWGVEKPAGAANPEDL